MGDNTFIAVILIAAMMYFLISDYTDTSSDSFKCTKVENLKCMQYTKK